jgi:hypothetical protein
MPILYKACDMSTSLTKARILELKSLNILAAGRYMTGSSKYLTKAEVNLCRDNAFGLFPIHEGMGDRATFAQGALRGHADGLAAGQAAQTLGFPPGLSIFSSVDYGAAANDIQLILAYEAGFISGCQPYAQGIYADGTIAAAEPTGTKIFLAGAGSWPGTANFLAYGRASLAQHPPAKLSDGTEYDPVDVYDDSVIWWPGGKPQQQSQSKPDPQIFMPTTVQGLQAALGVTIDGIRGPQTQAALLKWYTSL